jgi:hypothetical protein
MGKKKPIVSSLGQWAYPGEVTIIPSNSITMKGVGYPVLGVDNLGNSQMMMPGADYTFPGNYVTEYPQMQFGGMSKRKIDKILNQNKDLNFVQRMYQSNTPSIIIPGQPHPATHFMESADGRVYPTVVQMPDGSLQYLGDNAYNYANQTGEYIEFSNDRQARRFAKNYKKGTGVLEEFGKGGLTQWFAEEWTDVKTGKPCGRSGKEKGSRPYPACRPKKRVNETTPKTTSEMSSAEKAKFKREKTSGKRIDYNHKRRQLGGQEDSTMENIAEFFDPTGYTSWDDANRAYNEWKKSNSVLPSMSQALDMFGAVPALGKFGKLKYLDPNSIKTAYKAIPWQKILNAFDTAEDEVSKTKKKYGGWLDQYQSGRFSYTPPSRRAFTTSYQEPVRSTSDNTRVVTPNTNVSDATRAMIADQRAREAAAKRSGVIYAGTPESNYEKAKKAASFVEQEKERTGSASPMSYVLDVVNPATYAFAATDLTGNQLSAIKNLAQGNFQEAGSDLLDASINALTLYPGVSTMKGAIKPLSKFLRATPAQYRAVQQFANNPSIVFSQVPDIQPSASLSNLNKTDIRYLSRELLGEALSGNKNRQAIAEGNAWLKNWIDDPITQAKIDTDLGWIPERNNILKDQFSLGYEQAKSFTPLSKEYPFSEQFKDLFVRNQPHIHSGNSGVSYLHRRDPYSRSIGEMFSNPKLNSSWISRNLSMSKPMRRSTTIHEGTHDWTSDFLLRESGQLDDIKKLYPDKIKEINKNWQSLRDQGINPSTVMGTENANLGYLADPTEVHARVMELRQLLGMTPEQSVMVTPEKAADIIRIIQKPENAKFIDPKFLDVIESDPKKLASLFNRLWATAPIGIGAAGIAQLPEQKNGGWLEEYQIGGVRAPIYTSNLNDPRLRAYNDSAFLYAQTKPVREYPNIFVGSNIVPYKNKTKYIDNSGNRLVSRYPEIKPTHSVLIDNIPVNPIYARPVQPVIYRKPAVPKVYKKLEPISKVVKTPTSVVTSTPIVETILPAPVVEPTKPSLVATNIDMDMYPTGVGMASDYRYGVVLEDGTRKLFNTKKEYDEWKALNNLDVTKAKITQGKGYTTEYYPENKKYGGWLDQYK